MQKTLILIRHAKAESISTSDFIRPLSQAGIEQAQKLGTRLSAEDFASEVTLVSAAKRTQMTAEALAVSFPLGVVSLEEPLYGGDGTVLVNLVQQQAGSTVTVIGHEPIISTTAASLATKNDPQIDKIWGGVPTATAIILNFVGAWSELDWGTCSIENIWHIPVIK